MRSRSVCGRRTAGDWENASKLDISLEIKLFPLLFHCSEANPSPKSVVSETRVLELLEAAYPNNIGIAGILSILGAEGECAKEQIETLLNALGAKGNSTYDHVQITHDADDERLWGAVSLFVRPDQTMYNIVKLC